MLILKGNSGKSVLANIILSETYSRSFEYNDYPVMHGSVCLDSTKHSLEDFKECIVEWHNNNVYPDEHLDYLIIYTNQSEESLTDFIDWLSKNVWSLHYKDAIVMCK